MSGAAPLRYGVVRVGPIALGVPIEHLTEVFPVSRIHPLPKGSSLLRGGVELRGRMIPVLDISHLAGLAEAEADGTLGVVIERDRKQLAFRVSEILGITDIRSDNLAPVADEKSEAPAVFDRVFAYGGRFVSILDVDRLFAMPGVFTTDRPDFGTRGSESRRRPMMTFEAGSALYAVPAVEVYAAVPKQAIQVTAIASGPCLGEINYHNRRVPVVCPVQILGLGASRARSQTEVVVLRFPDDLVLGLAVDAIRDIRGYPGEKKTRIPVDHPTAALIDCVYPGDTEDEQIYAIDIDRLRAVPDVLDIARLSRDRTDESKAAEKADAKRESDTGKSNIIREQERYLVVETDERIAIPLCQVNCILEPPARTTPVANDWGGFKGYFTRLGETVALIDLRERLGKGVAKESAAKVLLTGESGRQVGFLVDKVISIEVSQWREKEPEKGKGLDQTVVQLGSKDNRSVLPYFDLLATIADLRLPATVEETSDAA